LNKRPPPSLARRASTLRAPLLALAAGLAFPLGFAPFGWWPVALLALAILFALWRDRTAAAAALLGLLFGFGAFGAGVSWVYVSMHTFGGMVPALAATTTALFALYLALFPALAGNLQARFRWLPPAWRVALAAPLAWVACEWLRGMLFTGFPWLSLGYAFIDTPLAGLAPLLGSHGVGLAAAFSAAGLAVSVHRRPRLIALAAVAVLWGATAVLDRQSWAVPRGAPLDVALVQANVPLAQKWSAQERSRLLAGYLDLSRQAADAALIVWPEAAVPGLLHELPASFWRELAALSRAGRTQFLFGALEEDSGEADRFYNSLVHFDGASVQTYRKYHLVPFGEYVPLVWLARPLLAGLSIPMSNLSPGPPAPAPLRVAGTEVGASICYEDAFARDIRRATPEAALLVNVSEDAWFGDSLGPHQRLQMARMRSLEVARPMLRAGNTGPSTVIDHRGRVLASSPQFAPAVLRATVQPMTGTTPFDRYGDWPVGILWVLCAAFASVGRCREPSA